MEVQWRSWRLRWRLLGSIEDGIGRRRLFRGMDRVWMRNGECRSTRVVSNCLMFMLISLESRSGLLQQGENVIFNANVETSPLRRRASRLLAIAVAPRRKSRELVLTDRRLICIKSKPGRYMIRYEFPLKAPLKEKEARYHLTGVEAKGDKEFVVLTVSLSFYIYAI